MKLPTTPAGIEAELIALIQAHIDAHPRSLQKAIGPSELGTPCQRKLGHKLAGTPETWVADRWKATIGTAVHAEFELMMARAAIAWANQHGTPPAGATPVEHARATRWLTEQRVTVGTVAGRPVKGHCDLFDTLTGTVLDWKFTTKNKIRTQYKPQGPGQTYRHQAHLYGAGMVNAGHQVNRVGIFFLTRDGMLTDRYLWSEPFRPDVAQEALTRANTVADLLAVLPPGDALAALDRTDDYCTYCPFLSPSNTDPATGCPGAPATQAATAIPPNLQDALHL